MASPEGNVFSGLSLPSASSIPTPPVGVPSQKQQNTSCPEFLKAAELFAIAKGVIDESLCQQVGAIFQFHIQYDDNTTRLWTVDAKNSPGYIVEGDKTTGNCIPDVILKLKENTFQKIFYGQLSPKSAYMSSQLSVSGSINVAMKLELLINKLKSV